MDQRGVPSRSAAFFGRRPTRRSSLAAFLAALMSIGSGVAPAVAPVAASPVSPFGITNVDSPDPVASGAQLMYTITITNTGGAKADGMVMTDQLNGVGGIGSPPQLVLTSSQGSCIQQTTLVTCTGGTMPGGSVWTITIRGVVTAAGGTTMNNTAQVTGTKSAQTFTSSATATTLVTGSGPGGPSPDLTISKNGPASVAPSAAFNYVLTVNNLGTAIGTNVEVTDTLPAGVGFAGYVATNLFACVTSGGPVPAAITVSCSNGRINAGTNATITINAMAPATNGTLENTAVVDPNDAIDEGLPGQDPAEFNNTSNKLTTTVGQPAPPPVSITKTGEDTRSPGDTIHYTIVVTNGNVGRADYLTMTDGTQGLEASSIHVDSAVAGSGTTPACAVNAPKVTCTMTRLAVNDTMTVKISGIVVASAGSTILNTASVNANIKNTGYTATASKQTIIKPAVDLTITKSDSPDPVCVRSWPGPGGVCQGGLTWTFIVGNSGLHDALNVLVRDPLPANVIFDHATPASFGCAVNGSNVMTCTIPTVPAESTVTFTVVVVAPPSTGTISNTVFVDPNNSIFESDETNNVATETTTVITGIDLTIAKFDSPPQSPQGFDPIATSGTETYVIQVDNIGTQDASNIRVRDSLPAATTFLSVTATNGFTCSYSAGVVECIGGAIRGTESESYDPPGPAVPLGPDLATITIKIFARPNIGTMHNEVRVDPLGEIAEADETNNIATQDTTVTNGGAIVYGAFNELYVTKDQTSPVGPTPVAPNGTLIYTIHVFNDGTDPAINVNVKDFLPAGTRHIQATADSQFLCTQAGGIVNCDGGILPAHATTVPSGAATITIKVFAPATPATYTNQAIVDQGNLIPEGNETNNAASVQTIVALGGGNAFNELSITKTDAVDPIATSSIETWTITVSNSGSDPAFNVAVRDFLPTGWTYIEAVDGAPGATAFFCSLASGNVLNCTGATITSGGSRTITVKAFASAVPGTYVNQALVDPDNTIPEADETNNAAQQSTVVTVGAGYIDLTVTKADSPDPVTPGGTLTYTITATNNGTNPAFGVLVRDQLPAGTTFVSAADTAGGPGAFICTQSGGIVDCAGGTLDGTPGDPVPLVPASRTITIVVKAPLVHGVTITNQAFIDPNNTIPESNETNNQIAEQTSVMSAVNLTITKNGPQTSSQGQPGTYDLVVENTGTDPAFGVHVHDALPVGMIVTAAHTEDPSHNNFSCQVQQNPVNVVDCTGDLNGSNPSVLDPFTKKVTIHIDVFMTANDGTNLENEACVDPQNTIVEQNENDNCSTATTHIGHPDLAVTKAAQTGTVTNGQDEVWLITVSNQGDAVTTGPITLTDNLNGITPGALQFVSAPATNGFNCTESSGTVTCTGATLAPGGSTVITLTTKVITSTGPISNKATVSTDGAELVTGNQSATATISVGNTPTDLVLVSAEDSPDPVPAGDSLTYTIKVTNAGTSNVTGILVRDSFLTLTGLTFISATGSEGFTCDPPAGNIIDCHGALDAGHTTTINIVFTATAAAPPSIGSTVTVDPADAIPESNETNNEATVVTSVSGAICSSCIDLIVAGVLATPDPVAAGGSFTYKITVGNVGDLQATDIGFEAYVFGDVGGAMTVSSSDGTWDCRIDLLDPSHVICDPNGAPVGTKDILAPGHGTVITITVPVDGGATSGDTFITFGSVDPSNAISEFDDSNNFFFEVKPTVS